MAIIGYQKIDSLREHMTKISNSGERGMGTKHNKAPGGSSENNNRKKPPSSSGVLGSPYSDDEGAPQETPVNVSVLTAHHHLSSLLKGTTSFSG